MSRDYDFIHAAEQATVEHDPNIGLGDVSKCLPGWIKTLCQANAAGRDHSLSAGSLGALLHTLIAARVRQHRLIGERDAALALVAAIERGGYDVSPCLICQELTVCIPDGLAICRVCAEKANKEG